MKSAKKLKFQDGRRLSPQVERSPQHFLQHGGAAVPRRPFDRRDIVLRLPGVFGSQIGPLDMLGIFQSTFRPQGAIRSETKASRFGRHCLPERHRPSAYGAFAQLHVQVIEKLQSCLALIRFNHSNFWLMIAGERSMSRRKSSWPSWRPQKAYK